MERLTVKGFVWKGTSNFRNIGRWNLAECLNRLSEYEDTNLTPDEINALRERGINDGWIPADERLPEVGKYVLCTNKYGEVLVYRYGWNGPHTRKMFFHLCGAAANITAWRPLPEPYQPEQTTQRPEWQERMLHTFLGGHT